MHCLSPVLFPGRQGMRTNTSQGRSLTADVSLISANGQSLQSARHLSRQPWCFDYLTAEKKMLPSCHIRYSAPPHLSIDSPIATWRRIHLRGAVQALASALLHRLRPAVRVFTDIELHKIPPRPALFTDIEHRKTPRYHYSQSPFSLHNATMMHNLPSTQIASRDFVSKNTKQCAIGRHSNLHADRLNRPHKELRIPTPCQLLQA